jgi:hypothetical protein
VADVRRCERRIELPYCREYKLQDNDTRTTLAIETRIRKISRLSHALLRSLQYPPSTHLDGTTDTLQIGRIVLIPSELITSTGSVREDVQSVVAKCIASYAIISSNRRAA